MRVLFLHNNFPGQYRRILAYLKNDPLIEDVVACTLESNTQTFPAKKVVYKPHRDGTKGIHPAAASFETSIISAQNVFKQLTALKNKGWAPDLICGHSGWGPTLFLRDLWPDARMLTYYEWWYNSIGSDVEFLSKTSMSPDERVRMRMKNATFLADMAIMDWGQCPTRFQHGQFPKLFRDAIEVLHDGVDVEYFSPDPNETFTVGDRTFKRGDEVVTYATRGMEPYRGFPQFMEAVAKLQKTRPNMQVVIVGKDRAAYGAVRKDGKTYKEHALRTLDLDESRIHFTGLLSLKDLRSVFRISAVHTYFTVPFVLSWSMLEAMSAGVLLLASDTAPVREIVTDGENGLLTDFFDVEAMASRIDEALSKQQKFAPLRKAARAVMTERYSTRYLLPAHRQLMIDVATGVKSCRD